MHKFQLLFCFWVTILHANDENHGLNFYEELNVQPTAKQREIRKSYLKLSHKTHPDRNSHPDATKQFQQLGKAYDTLGNPTKRRAYDARLHSFDESASYYFFCSDIFNLFHTCLQKLE